MTSPAPRGAPEPGDEPGDEPEARIGPMTFEQYLEFEQASDVRHEFVDGYAYAMSPVRRGHNRITLNIVARLWALTRGTTCETYVDGFLLRTPRGRAYYPDAMVSCSPTLADDALFLGDPCLAVEVLSPGTERVDHGEKWESYREIPTLSAYLIVETAWRAVHRRWRDADGAWRSEVVSGADSVVPLPCPAGGVLALEEIYEGTRVPPDLPESPRLRRVREQAATYAAAEPGPDAP